MADHKQVPWTRQKHRVFETRVLTADDPRAQPSAEFQGRLWAPQATLLQGMLDLEARPVLRTEAPAELAHPTAAGCGEVEALFQCQGARIAAEFSFGKTVLCIALVCTSRRPRAFPTPLNFLTMDAGAHKNRLCVANHSAGRYYQFKEIGRGVFPTLHMRFQRMIDATLVVAAPSVISQWEDCIRAFAPHLQFFTIENVQTLRQFHDFFQSSRMDSIDLVLLKAGKVTTSFVVDGEPKPEARQRPLTRALSVVTEGYVWSRMIVDDFDTIRLASEDCFLPSLFTWVISATMRSTTVRRAIIPAATVAEFIRANRAAPILGAASNALFDKILKLRCEDQYVHDHINTTTVSFRRVVVEGGHAVGILQDLGVPDDVLEMAAAGAVETAAERLDIKVNTIGELVDRVLAARVEKYRKAVLVLERVRRAREAAARSALARNDGEGVKMIRRTLKEGTSAEAEDVLAKLGRPGSLFTHAMATLEEWASKEKNEHGGRLQRMRENVRQNRCQACMVPIDGAGESYVVNCCQIVICAYCTVVGEGRRRRYIRRCPNCVSAVDPKRHLIYVGADLELEMVLADEALLAAPEEAEEEDEPAPAPAESAHGHKYAAWEQEPRLRALLQLICGDPVQSVSDAAVAPTVQGLLEGRRAAPVPASVPHRYLVFAMHAESMHQIAAALDALRIPHALLRGTRQKREEAVCAFKTGKVAVIVATSSRDCAGLHLPEVTRLILYHHHVNKHVAEQSVGRAQRVGREYSLEVVVIMNEGEAERFG